MDRKRECLQKYNEKSSENAKPISTHLHSFVPLFFPPVESTSTFFSIIFFPPGLQDSFSPPSQIIPNAKPRSFLPLSNFHFFLPESFLLHPSCSPLASSPAPPFLPTPIVCPIPHLSCPSTPLLVPPILPQA